MNRQELIKYIGETYNADPQFPWIKYPSYMVFRHSNNQKWFALIMDIPSEKLGLQSQGIMDVLNVKCDPMIIESLITEPGFYPAYHMNKAHWVTVSLNGSIKDEKIKYLLDMSFNLTAVNLKNPAKYSL